MNTKVLLMPLLALAACSSPSGSVSRNSPTFYIQTTGTSRERHESLAPLTHLRQRPGATPSRTIAAPSNDPLRGATPSPTITAPSNDSLRVKRAELLARIEGLSRDECDSVSLRLGLIPREKVFDRDSNPKKHLLRYTSEVSSREDLEFIERTLNDRR